MRTLTASELIEIWSAQDRATVAETAFDILHRVSGPEERASLSTVTLGERDRMLMRLRSSMLGSGIEAVASCPACASRLDITFSGAECFDAIPVSAPDPVQRVFNGYTVTYRPVVVGDLSPACDAGLADAKRRILRRCILEIRTDGETSGIDDLPAETLAMVSESMAELDPLADIQLDARCPDCGHAWQTAFDIASFLLMELEREATNLLGDVHLLASAYHWSEADILALHPARRKYYLDRIMNG
jgi:hypothetical protein